MTRYVIVRCLARVGSDDVQYDAMAAGEPLHCSEESRCDWFGMNGSDYQRLVHVACDSDMTWRVIADRLYIEYPHSARYSPDEMHAIQTPDTALAAVDVARAYAWPKEYAEWDKAQIEQDEKDRKWADAMRYGTGRSVKE